jgi:hypothetical protein
MIWILALILMVCGEAGAQEQVIRNTVFRAAEARCGLVAVEPSIEWVGTVPCADSSMTCCIRPDRGSEYDPDSNTVILAGPPECRNFMLRVNLPCEYENAVTWQHGETIDRCQNPC